MDAFEKRLGLCADTIKRARLKMSVGTFLGLQDDFKRHGWAGIEEFEDNVIRPLLIDGKLEYLHSTYPKWTMNILKVHYDIDTCLYESAISNLYILRIKNKEHIFIDDYKLDNYFN